MTNKIKIALVSGLIIVAIIVYLIYLKNTTIKVSQNLNTSSVASTTLTTNSEIPVSTKERAWAILQKYLESAKAHDITGVTALSYQRSESCKKINESEEMKKDCENRMNTVYSFGSGFKKEDFIYTWSDSKQIILSTDWVTSDEKDSVARVRSIIYFVIGNDKTIKILSFKPVQGTFASKFDKQQGEPDIRLTDRQTEDRITKYTEDKDQDGIEDFVETCSGSSDTKDCVKTDPTKRDSNNNGFWDGVEAVFYK